MAAFHDPLIVALEDGRYLGLSTDLDVAGVQARYSNDLLNWGEPFTLLKETPETVKHHCGTDHFWAPELIKRKDRWRLYCCASRFGTTQSIIGLAESDTAEGPFAYQGEVVVTNHCQRFTQPNAIDPCVCADRNGKDWLIYGSFFGGIHVLPLGDDGFPEEYNEGKLIAGGNSQAIEGAYCIYHEPSDRFILFTSWGDLKCSYHVRVGYSKEISGPYLDSNGIDLANDDPIHSPGDMLCAGYHFGGLDETGIMATGHNSVMKTGGETYMVHHARPEYDVKHPFLQIRRLLFDDSGRVYASPVPYNGKQILPCEQLPENWNIVYLCRLNMGVTYSVYASKEQLSMELQKGQLYAKAFGKNWKGQVWKQGEQYVFSMLSDDGETLWGIK